MNSMTGFGGAEAPLHRSSLSVEISGVNRKQTEVAIALPRAWAKLETLVREAVTGSVSRGRVNVSISLKNADAAGGGNLSLNREKLQNLQHILGDLNRDLGQDIQVSLDSLVRLGILTEETESDIPADTAWTAIETALAEALSAFLSLRAREGARLKQDLLGRIGTLRQLRGEIIARASGVTARHRETLMKRLEEAGLPLAPDDERLIKEIALFADKCDVTEEVTRLASHLDQFEAICNRDEAVGRTLDFLCQEIFRELNTTGSKANDADLAQIIVTAKTELEKIREQVQNVE